MKLRTLFTALPLCALTLAAYAGVEQSVTELIPTLAAAKVEDRYSAQMELQHLAANASRPGAEAERAELAKILAAKAADPAVPQPARVWIVRQIEYIGAAESVPALTTLLKNQDAELKECARRALEKNSDPAATESLRAALKAGGDSRWTVGLIQSLGQRGDAQSVALIAPSLSQPETAFAAACALGKIATEPAIEELQAALVKNTAGAGDALVSAANRLTASGESKRALAVYVKLYAVPDNIPLRAAALVGLAKANPDGAKKLIEEGLSSPEWCLQNAAVTAAQQVYGKDASSVLVGMLAGLKPGAKVFVVRALDASAEKEVIAAAGDSDEALRLAAIERLGQIGSAAAVPVLFPIAMGAASEPQKAALFALSRMCGPGSGAAIVKLAAQGEPKSRATAINLLAQRDDQAALPELLKYAAEADSQVSGAACAALGKVGTDKELEGLVQLVLSGKCPGASAALQAVATRAHDKSAASQKLVALTRTAPPQQLGAIFDILAVLGSPDALPVVSSFAGGSNADAKDAAIRALVNWPDFNATKILLVIASDPNSTLVHKVLAVQGVARLVKTSDTEPADARLKAATTALNLAPRDEEKKLMLSALASVHDRKAGAAIKSFLTVPKYQQEAGLAAVTLAEALRRTDRPGAKELAQAVKNAAISDEITKRANAILNKN